MDKEGKITITFKVDFEEDEEVKEGNSFRTSAFFATLEQLHERVETISVNLCKTLKKKLPADFKQPKIDDYTKDDSIQEES